MPPRLLTWLPGSLCGCVPLQFSSVRQNISLASSLAGREEWPARVILALFVAPPKKISLSLSLCARASELAVEKSSVLPFFPFYSSVFLSLHPPSSFAPPAGPKARVKLARVTYNNHLIHDVPFRLSMVRSVNIILPHGHLDPTDQRGQSNFDIALTSSYPSNLPFSNASNFLLYTAPRLPASPGESHHFSST